MKLKDLYPELLEQDVCDCCRIIPCSGISGQYLLLECQDCGEREVRPSNVSRLDYRSSPTGLQAFMEVGGDVGGNGQIAKFTFSGSQFGSTRFYEGTEGFAVDIIGTWEVTDFLRAMHDFRAIYYNKYTKRRDNEKTD